MLNSSAMGKTYYQESRGLSQGLDTVITGMTDADG